jgi:hypothetical protein
MRANRSGSTVPSLRRRPALHRHRRRRGRPTDAWSGSPRDQHQPTSFLVCISVLVRLTAMSREPELAVHQVRQPPRPGQLFGGPQTAAPTSSTAVGGRRARWAAAARRLSRGWLARSSTASAGRPPGFCCSRAGTGRPPDRRSGPRTPPTSGSHRVRCGVRPILDDCARRRIAAGVKANRVAVCRVWRTGITSRTREHASPRGKEVP